MQDLDRNGLPFLLFFRTKTHIEGIAFSILLARFSANYCLLEIFLYNSWLMRPCFYLLYESRQTCRLGLEGSRVLKRKGGHG